MPCVLIAEDEPAIVALITAALGRPGIHFHLASNGRQAVEMAREERPDLVLMDADMPLMDGYQACRLIKAQRDSPDIPVVFLSARTRSADRQSALDAGGQEYITKPFSPTKLRELVEQMLAG